MMKRSQTSYSIVQFFPDSVREEGLNLGVLLYDADKERVLSRFSSDFSRIMKSSAAINKSFLNIAIDELKSRIDREIAKKPAFESLKRFQSMRANNIRLTPFLPTFAEDAEIEIERLYDDLVGDVERKPRKSKVAVKLKRELRRLNLLDRFDQNPQPISLPRYNLKLRPDLAIRRERYNLIEASRFDEPERGLEQAGKHALAGRALMKNLGMQLVVVGDFGEQSNDYVAAIKEDLARSNTSLFLINELGELAKRYTLH
ncbi:DUF3037 domain-containing protein [Roseovarius spongiae]|uniref:DUF3037 domain-containing protein n=1 Tax=Roseovarius spongiae TaxID=2320272 RepID=A0A3A8ASU1_9RHOB|nr:DUF3037 domain-containing protein [Roseovarius spongiae]RKF13468.1 DUF3037 domain-containing protein [Roseovarius spongiae]